MNFNNARFMTSAADMVGMPDDTGREVAFAGRSNAGKSSALNRLTHRRNLARTSGTPGRTQLINFFALDEAAGQRLVDLPGYGFARAPRAAQNRWAALVERYLAERVTLTGMILLVDSRHVFKPGDEQLLDWAQASGLPLLVLLTKADKLKRGARAKALAAANSRLPVNAEALVFSARTGLGLDTTRQWLVHHLEP